MVDVIVGSLKDTLKMVPILFVVYLALEYVETRWQQRMVNSVERAGKVGPLLASVGGVLPQCGFSVMASALYTERLLTMGTIVAVYLATSDEALPILLSKPGQRISCCHSLGLRLSWLLQRVPRGCSYAL